MYPGYALSSHITKTQISEHLCTLATADKRHITQNTNQQNLMYPCKRTQQSHYTKHKSANTYVHLPPSTEVTLHVTQISKHLCTLATAHSSHISQNTNKQTLMYTCHRPQQSHYTKHKSANTYLPLPPPTAVTLHKSQISKPYVPLPPPTKHPLYKTQISKTLMYPCHSTQHSHYTKHKSEKLYVHLPPPTPVILHKTQISIPLGNFATAHTSHITQNTNQQPLCNPTNDHNSHITQNTNQQNLMYP